MEYPSSALIRATIFVQDVERATHFYRSIGLSEVYFEGWLDDASASSVLGLKTHHPYFVRIVKRPGPNFGMMGLFQLADETEADTLPASKGAVRRGEVALVFYVRSMETTLTRLRAAGATWAPDPVMFKLQHRQQQEVCIRDCDGVLINLVETDPEDQNITETELTLAARRLAHPSGGPLAV